MFREAAFAGSFVLRGKVCESFDDRLQVLLDELSGKYS
jgi:hypothetical protein